MLSNFRFSCGRVSRIIGIAALSAILFVAGCTTSGKNEVTIGPPAKLAFTAQPGSLTSGNSITPTVAVSIEDAQGHVVTTATTQITIAIGTNPSAGTLSGTLSASAVAGVATFSNLSINNVGSNYTLAASATGLTGATSSAFNVVGPPTKLAFTMQPSAVINGSSITPGVSVSIEDAQGNVVTSATNQITIAIGTNPSAGTLSGTVQANAVAGVATFSNLSINKLGIGYTLTASATNLTSATSSAFNVTAGPPAKLAFTVQPVNTTAGVAISPAVQVTVEDSQGNTVTTATNTITIGAGGVAVIGTTAVNAVNGVATFSNLSINVAGTGYTLAASAPVLTGATSTAFNILAGAAAKMVFTGEPSNVAAGSSITPGVIVSVEDAQGNVVTSATNQITIAIGTNPSSGTLSGTAQTNAVAGVATFSNLSINKIGAGYTLTNSTAGLAGTTSTAFNVTAGVASKMVFTAQPTNTAAGAAINPAVAVSIEDAQSNVVTSANSTVTLSIGTNPSSGALSGTAAVAAVNGVATFSTLKINNAGIGYTLAAADGALNVTSTAFNVTVGAASKLAFTVQPTSVTAGSSISPSVVVSVEDSQGNVVTTATNSITMAIGTNPSSGTLGGTPTVAAVNGVATFPNLSINNAGTGYTLSASAGGLTGAISTAFNVTVGAAAKLVFSVQPTNTAAGAAINPAVAVSIEDAQSNVVTSANSTVTLSIGTNPSSGALSGTAAVAAVNGVATFSTLKINNAGTGYTLAAADGALNVTSTAFNVTVGAASKLAFTVQPTSVTAGSSISPSVVVSVEDSQGNVVTTATNSITMAIGTNPSAGTLGGTLSIAAVNGVATFSTLNINNAGNGYALSANAGGLTGATSTPFNVTAGPAAKLAFTVQPSNVIPGNSISPAVAVSIEDALGNVVTSAANSITMAIGANPGSGTLAGTLTVAAVNGVATFPNLSINNTGVGYTLTASATGFTTVTSNAFSNAALGVPAKLAFTVQPSNVTTVSSITPSVTVTVEDGAGNPVNTATNSITIAIGTNPSSGTLGGTLTVAAVNGVATFSTLNINKAGPGYTLTANAATLTGATSTAFNVTAGAANKLAFTVQPTNVTAGSAISPAVTVSVEDSLGNVVTTATNSISMVIGTNPSSGTLGGTVTVAAVNGVATFSTLNINKAGPGYTLTANAATLIGATSTAFNVTAGAANKLAFTVQPTNVTAGSTISPAVTVSVEDSLGNVVTTATNSITMAVGTNPSSGTLGGTLTVAAVNGVASFSTLNINNAGTGYTLSASVTGLTGATSTAFNVTVGAANKLAFTVQPTNVTAGSFISPVVTVSVEDSLGNVVTTATNSITMAIGSNPSSGTLGGTLTVAAVNGVASFSTLNINNAGTGYTLTAGATGFTTITSATFNVTIGTANKLALTVQPTSVTAGNTISPSVTVSVEDASGNLVTTATNSITIAIATNPSGGTLGGTVTVAAVNGVATFSTLNINNAGNGYTLKGSATGLTGATSTAFNVTAAAASKLAFTVQPTNITIGSTISPSVTVSVEDALGNVVTGATNSITVAIGTNPSGGTLGGTLTVAAVNGVASFSTLNINATGNGYTLTASAGVFTTVTSNTFNVTQNCTNNCAISGTVTGAWVSGVTITLSGGPSTPAPAVTNSSGTYSFTGLTQGTYTITPSLVGYTYAPSTPSVSIGASTVQNFVASSALTSYSISGTITYAGSKTGNTILRVFQNNCTGCGVVAGTSFPSKPSSTGTSYIIRGLPPTNGNNYVVQAEIDTVGDGIANESDPEGTSSTVTLPSADATGINFAVVDRTPSAPQMPPQNKFSIAPGNQAAVIQYKAPTDNNGEEIATSYNVYYGTDAAATNGVGSPQNFKAQGNNINIFILGETHPLTNGSTYFFKITALNTTESVATTPVSAVIGAVTGSGTHTVTGAVTFPGTATGPLFVGVYGNNGIFTDVIQSPTSGVAYTITGVPSGTYQNFAIIDMNKDGEVGTGDLTDVSAHSNPPTISVNANVAGANIALTSFTAAPAVRTFVQGSSGQPNSYSLSVQIDGETELPVSMTLFSGKNVAVPYDMNADQHNGNYNPIYTNSISPTAGDIYQFLVTFSDGGSSVISAPITAVLSSSFPGNLAMNSPVAGSATVPVLNWTAPTTTPPFTPYTYSVNLNNNNGSPQENWNYNGPNNGNGIPSNQTSVTFDTDGSANPSSSLTPGATYNWSVTVGDNDNNGAQYSASYTVPGGAVVSPVVTVSFNPTAIAVGGTATLVFNINNPNGSTSLTGIAFSNTLTGGLSVVGTSPNNGCGATLGGTGSGSTSINVSNVALAAGASCQIGINVTSNTPGTVNNQTSTVTSNEAGTGSASNTASLSVGGSGILPPSINISFNPSTIQVNFSTTLTFNINNPNAASSLSGVGFTDALPANLFVLSPNNFLSGSCGSGTITAVAGSQSISLSGGTLGAGGGCSFSVGVTATATGTINDTTGNITSNEGGTGGTSNTAALTVNSGGSSAPSINSNGNADFFVGMQETFTVNASGAPSPSLSVTGALPTGVTFTDDGGGGGTLSGKPATGTAGSYPLTITASNGNPPNATESFALTVTSLACPLTTLGHESLLTGTYVSLFNGFKDANGPSQAISVFVANGTGGITNGELDFGTVLNFSGGSYATPVAPQKATITSSGSCYNLGSDNRGTMVWNLSTGTPITMAFSVRGDGALGRIIEFDDPSPSLTATGGRGSGTFLKRTISGPFNLSSLTGPFAFGLSGYNNDNCGNSSCNGSGDGGYQRLASVGRFTSNGAGSLSGFVFDVAQVNSGGTSSQGNIDLVSAASASSYTAPDALGRGTLTISGNDARIGGPFTIDYAYYLIDATHFFIQSIDAPTNGPLFNGEAIGQSGSFSVASLNGNAFFSMTGADVALNSYTVIAGGRISGVGSGSNVSTLMDKSSNGSTVSTGTTAITGGTFTATANGMGTLTIGSGGSAQAFSVAMIGTNSGFIMEGTQASPGANIMAGLMEPQTAPGGGFTNSAASGLFIESEGFPSSTNAKVEVGSLTFTPANPTGSISGTSDKSNSPSSCNNSCLVLNSPLSATYSIDANGRISLISNGTAAGWLRDTSHGVLLIPDNNGLTIQLDH